MHDAPQEKTFCEFFAGIGLVHEALRQSGWRCVYANDIDAKKHAMHQGHFGPSPEYHLGDVWDTASVLERLDGQPFLATASFPCTDMSLAGLRRGLAGKESGALFGFLRVLEELGERRPAVVLLENVPGFLNSHDGTDFATAIDELSALGYWLDAFVIDAKWFVPQSRPRLFLVGYQESALSRPLIRRSDDGDSLAGPWQRAIERSARIRPARLLAAMESISPRTGWATIDCGSPRQTRYKFLDFIDADDGQAWWNADEIGRHLDMMFDRHRRQIESLQADSCSRTALTGFRRIREGQQRLEVRFDGVAGCLRTPRGGSAKQVVILIDRGELKMRWMSPREYARLQGASDYTLPANKIQGLFGFGDAVCVPVIEWIDRQMLTPVYEGFRVWGSEVSGRLTALPA